MTTALSVLASRDVVTEQDIEILRNSKFKGFSDPEIAYCARISNALGLNPLLNQIHFVKRKNKDGSYAITAQTAIDGFRLAAQRTKAYAGSDDAVFEYAPADKVQKRPIKATVTVYRIVEGHRCSFTASARWEEFYDPVGGQWDRMPHVMLGKCAEAQSLRKAFPAELSDLYTPEEMDQSDRPSKAQDVQAKILPAKAEPIEVESTPVESAEPEAMACPQCQSEKIMASKYTQGQMYCRECKLSWFPQGSA